MGMGHVPKDPLHPVGASTEFQGRQRRRVAVGGHHHSRRAVAAQRLARARWAEQKVAQWYERNGYEVVARNWTMRGGELDVVARKGSLIVVCEVKARANDDFGTALEAMTEQKIFRVRRAGFAFLRELSESGLRVRFDVATMSGVQLEFFHDAF